MYKGLLTRTCFFSLVFFQSLHPMETASSFFEQFYATNHLPDLPEDLYGEIAKCKQVFSPICADKPYDVFKCYGTFIQLLFSSDSRKLMASDGMSLDIFDIERGKFENRVENAFSNVLFGYFALGSDNQTVAVAQKSALIIHSKPERRVVNVGKPIQQIHYTHEGKIFITPDMDFSTVSLYDPETDKTQEIATDFSDELKLSFSRIDYGELCRNVPENIKGIAGRLNAFYQINPQVFSQFNQIRIGNRGQRIIIMLNDSGYEIQGNSLLKLNTQRSLGFARLSSDDNALVVCDGMLGRTPKFTDLYSLKHHMPLMIASNAAAFAAISPDKKWLAALKWVYVTDGPPVHDFQIGWRCVGINLYKVDYLLNPEMDQLIAGQLNLQQLKFLLFLKDLKSAGLAPISLLSVKEGLSFTLDDIKKEFRKVFASFNPSVREYLRIQYKF